MIRISFFQAKRLYSNQSSHFDEFWFGYFWRDHCERSRKSDRKRTQYINHKMKSIIRFQSYFYDLSVLRKNGSPARRQEHRKPRVATPMRNKRIVPAVQHKGVSRSMPFLSVKLTQSKRSRMDIMTQEMRPNPRKSICSPNSTLFRDFIFMFVIRAVRAVRQRESMQTSRSAWIK